MIHRRRRVIVPPITLVFPSLIPHFSSGKSSLRADLDNPSQPSSPSVRHEIMDDKCSDLNPNLIQDYKPVAHL